MADFIWLPQDALNHKYHHSQILCKHVDFLACDRWTYRPLLAIELDDPSHRYADSQDRDEFKNRTFATVGLPLLRVTMADAYNVNELQMQIQAALAGAKSEDKTTIM